jgi:transposase InsO family protein
MLKAAEKAFCWCIVPTVPFSTHTLLHFNKVWTTDITYVWTLEGWLYVAVVIDLFSRQVVGWAVDDHMLTSLCIRALQMAFWRRQPAAGILHHSDRGSQYASYEYRHLILSEHVYRYKKLHINNADDCYFFGSKVFVI